MDEQISDLLIQIENSDYLFIKNNKVIQTNLFLHDFNITKELENYLSELYFQHQNVFCFHRKILCFPFLSNFELKNVQQNRIKILTKDQLSKRYICILPFNNVDGKAIICLSDRKDYLYKNCSKLHKLIQKMYLEVF